VKWTQQCCERTANTFYLFASVSSKEMKHRILSTSNWTLGRKSSDSGDDSVVFTITSRSDLLVARCETEHFGEINSESVAVYLLADDVSVC
jgi:hypothetical protein